SHPVSSVCQGLRRNSGVTHPPHVAAAQMPRKRTKNAMPRTILAPRLTGISGVNMSYLPKRIAGRKAPRSQLPAPAGLLDGARVDRGVELDLRLDHAGLKQNVLGLLQERLDLAAEEFLVRRLVLPAQIGLRFLERRRILLHRRAHDAEGFLRLFLDHRDGLE